MPVTPRSLSMAGSEGFERYTALAVLSRNIQRIGCIIRDRERKLLEKQKQAA